MPDIPDKVLERRDLYSSHHGVDLENGLRGSGMDGFVWQTTRDTIIKVFRHFGDYEKELSVYERLDNYNIKELQGFRIPRLIEFDNELTVLEISYVSPPYILDFAAATLDQCPSWFDAMDPSWIAEKRRVFGPEWPAVARLLDALRHIGIHYTDVHKRNICLSE